MAEALTPGSDDAPRQIPVHRSLVRPVLIAGGDRVLMGSLGVVCVALIVGTGFSWLAFVSVLFVFGGGTWAIQLATKRDPQFREVFLRHRWLDDEYGAAAEDDAPETPIHPSVPVSE